MDVLNITIFISSNYLSMQCYNNVSVSSRYYSNRVLYCVSYECMYMYSRIQLQYVSTYICIYNMYIYFSLLFS